MPYLLGLHPTESLILIGLNARAVAVTARIDLADLADTAVLADTLGAIKRGNASAVVGAIFTVANNMATEPITTLLNDQACALGLDLVDTLIVTDGRWRWS